MPKPVVEGGDKVLAKLKAIATRANIKNGLEVKVGYEAPYAIYVHEDLEAHHPNGGQAKYLEQPARELAKEMGSIVRKALRAGYRLPEALKMAGDFLLSESKPLVPMDTGFLRDSGFVEVS